jgi:hypothetical protein
MYMDMLGHRKLDGYSSDMALIVLFLIFREWSIVLIHFHLVDMDTLREWDGYHLKGSAFLRFPSDFKEKSTSLEISDEKTFLILHTILFEKYLTVSISKSLSMPSRNK